MTIQSIVKRGSVRCAAVPSSELCVAETLIQKRHQNETIVIDGTNSSVLYVDKDRTDDKLRTFYQNLTSAQRDAIMCVNLDWCNYKSKQRATNSSKERLQYVLTEFRSRKRKTRPLMRYGNMNIVNRSATARTQCLIPKRALGCMI